MRKNLGFTLIETLVVVALFVIVGGISVNLLFSAMKSSTKAAMMNQLKQNGDYALAVMERTIRNAKNVNSACLPAGSTLNILEVQNIDETTTSFNIDTTINNKIFKGSEALTSDDIAFFGSANYFVCSQTTGKPASILINFTLTPKNWGSNDPAPTMNFQTSITLRNY